MNHSTPVLIVGAGPTGLMMATELTRYNIPCRIIEQRSQRTQTSNALGIQARTLEVFDDIGMIDRFLQAGNKISTLQLHSAHKHFPQVSFETVDSYYLFLLTLPQSETERILEERLNEFGVQVERGTELIDIQHNPHAVTGTIKKIDGTEEKIIADWAIACDGAHSTIRKKLNIPFPGKSIPQKFIIADIHIHFKYPNTAVNVFLDNQTICAVFPIEKNRYRIVVNYLDDSKKEFSDADIKKIVEERTYHTAQFIDSLWISPFWIHSCLIDHMQQGHIFFAGDAAHIHSPAGGQGMNTGLQDAYNLAWKLALVINTKASPTLLDSYHAERYPVIKAIVRQTELMTKMILLKNPIGVTLRNILLKTIMKHRSLSRKVLMRISQLALHYTKSPIINYRAVMSNMSPQPGERAPDVKLNAHQRLADLLRGKTHHALFFSGLAPSFKEITQLKLAAQELANQYPDVMTISIIATKKIDGIHCILDEHASAHQRYHVEFPGIYLIRPDNYIACCSHRVNPQAMKKILPYLIQTH